MVEKGRKTEHLHIALENDVDPGYRYWEDIRLIHEALPEVNYSDIDTSSVVLGKKLDFPLIINAMTGGFKEAKRINENIAIACSKTGIGMGVGSQRPALDGGEKESYEIVKKYDVPLVIGNIGAPQLIKQNNKKALTSNDINNAIEMIDADYIAIHLNYLQETIQPEGELNSKGCLDAIRSIAREYPTIVKETGAGISSSTAKRLSTAGVRAIDISGMGGTSFSAIEMNRAIAAKNVIKAEMGMTYFDWGIPSTVSLLTVDTDIPVIASGGISSGLDVARSIVLGASSAGIARYILDSAMVSSDELIEAIKLIKEELKTAMMLTGCSTISELRNVDYAIIGKTKEWMEGWKRM